MKTASGATKTIEVIVSTLEDALEAEAGGADRLEVVRDLDAGGLTPDLSLVGEICSRVSVPVRVMLRNHGCMQICDKQHLEELCEQASGFSEFSVDGLVLGFTRDKKIDTAALGAICSAAPGMRITFHRAFDALENPIEGICRLKQMPMVDRILTTGGPGSWASRKLRLHYWQQHANPGIKVMAGAGVKPLVIADLMKDPVIEELHFGRAARQPAETSGTVCRLKVAGLRQA